MLGKWIVGTSLAMLLATAAMAAEINAQQPFAEQRAQIEKDLRGDTYREISAEDRAKVIAALERMSQRLGDGKQPQDLKGADQVSWFNDQELVNSLLTQAREDSRLVCERYRPTGSKMPQNLCLTVAQRRATREEAVDEIRQIRRSGGETPSR